MNSPHLSWSRFLVATGLLCVAAMCRADDIRIDGVNFSWQDSKKGQSEVEVKPGDVVTWIVKEGEHGLVFQDFAAAQKVLTIDPASMPIKDQEGFKAPAKGT